MKKWLYRASAWVLLAVLLTGCGDGSDAIENSIEVVEPVDMTVVSESGDTENPENPDDSGNAGASAEGETVEVRLQYNAGQLTVEAEAAILEAMTTLRQNLEVSEYLGEGIHMVSSEEWFETLSQGMYEGGRSYSLQKGDELLLTVQIGYDIDGEPYVNVFYSGGDNSTVLLKQAKGVTWIQQAQVSGGEYEGAFEIWRIDSGTGNIQWEQGTYSKGIIVGEYTKSEYTGGPGEAFDLWTNRENFEYKTTTQMYDENGEPAATATPQPSATPTAKPTASPKPTATPKPAQPTQEPQPEPEPEPNEPEEPPAPPKTPEPTPQPPAQPSEGDTDIEWSDDIM